MLLYKYSKAKWAIAILWDLRLRVSPPKEFNDGFEFTPTTTNPIAGLDREQLVRLNNWLHQQGCSVSSVGSLQKVLPVLMRTNPTVRDLALQFVSSDMAARVESSQHFGVLCLAEPRTDIRMWAHYGDENRGVAVGLDFDNETSGISGVVCFDKVKYDNCRPPLNPMTSAGEELHRQMLKIAMTKSLVWRAEREHRMIFKLEALLKEVRVPCGECGQRNLNYFVPIRPETIREVVMGCFILPRNECRIRELVKTKLPHVKLVKVKRHDTKFELVPVPASAKFR